LKKYESRLAAIHFKLKLKLKFEGRSAEFRHGTDGVGAQLG
jgi:hypothetical protein